ncbi:HIT family protein [Candidatus Saccharibacteria bacterium]|nr:HIT family protein [Candidatus Saccharibacteria bacterium]
MEDSIFTKIITGAIPSHKVYEDDLTVAFLDIHPVQSGHVLVVSKKQMDHFDDLPDEDYQAVWQTVKKIAKAQKKAFNPNRVGVQVVGLDVPHAHIHVIPFNSLDEYRNVPNMNAEPNHEELAVVANKIKECL